MNSTDQQVADDAAAALTEMGATDEQTIALIGICPRCKQETDNPHTCTEETR